MPERHDSFDSHDDLRALFAADRAPDLHVDPDAVLHGGRRRVRRRRAVRAVTGSVATVGAVVVLALGARQHVETGDAATAIGSASATVASAAPGAQVATGTPSGGSSPAGGSAAAGVPALPEPTGSCRTSAVSLAGDVPGEPTPYAAARALRVTGLDPTGTWREADRTTTSARLYKDGVWVSTIRTAKGGWVADGWTVCEGYTSPPLPPAVPEAATADGPGFGDPNGTVGVRLSGDPQQPDVTLDSSDGPTQRLTLDPAFAVPGETVWAYRDARYTVLLLPLGDDTLVTADTGGATGTAPGVGSGSSVEIGGLRYWVHVLGGEVEASDVRAVYRTAADGSVRSSTGEEPVVARFTAGGGSRFSWFQKAGYAVTQAGGSGGSGRWDGAQPWGSGGPGGFGTSTTQWAVGVLPTGAHDVQVVGAPGTTVHVQPAGRYVVVLAEQPLRGGATTAPAGSLRWTDAAGVRWERPETGETVRLS